jgi:hypothetical protein
VLLNPDRYRCRGGAARADLRTFEPSISIEAANHIVIDGRGATLVGTDMASLLRIAHSEHVTVRNLNIDWDPLPYTGGRVTAVHPEPSAFDLHPMVPATPLDGRITQAVLAYNPSRKCLADTDWEIYQTQGERDRDLTHWNPDGTLRVYQHSRMPLPQVGWHVVVRHQVYGFNALTFVNCRHVVVENVNIHAVPGMALCGSGCRDMVIRNLRVVPADPGWMSSTADAMHFNNCRGTITVEHCEFAGMGDDAINIHAMYGLVTSRMDDHTVAVARARLNPYYDTRRITWNPPEAADTIEYGYGDEPLHAKGRFEVECANQDITQERTIVRCSAALPEDVREGTVLWNLTATPVARIRDCRVRGNRARGMLLQTRDVTLERCVFEDTSSSGVMICTDAHDWWESLGVRDVTIDDCIFRRCNFGAARAHAALDIFAHLPHGQQAAAGVHQRITVRRCRFEDNGGAAIHIGSTTGVRVHGNRFQHPSRPVVRIVNSSDIDFIDNDGLDGTDGGIEGLN